MHVPALEPAARHPHREACIVMVAPSALLRFRRPPELAAPQHDRRIEHPAPLQILYESGDRLVGERSHFQVVFFDVGMRVPLGVSRAATGNHADKAHAFFHHAASQQTTPPVVIRLRIADSIEVQRLLWFLAQVEHFRCFGLHLERRIVSRHARGKFRILRAQGRVVHGLDEVDGLAPLAQRNALGQLQIQHRPIARTEECRLINRRQEPVLVHRHASLLRACRIGHHHVGRQRLRL